MFSRAYAVATCVLLASLLSGQQHTIRPDGSELRQLTTTPANDANAVWTDDSQYLMWNSGIHGFKGEAALYDNTFQPYGAIFIVRLMAATNVS